MTTIFLRRDKERASPFMDVVLEHDTGNALHLKAMVILHSYELENKPGTENSFM